MNCDEFRREILSIASGDVSGPEYREHMEACASCRGELEKARRLNGLLEETFQKLAPKAGFQERTAIRSLGLLEAARPRPYRFWLPWISAAAALLFAALSLVIALGLWSGLEALRDTLAREKEAAEKRQQELVQALLEEARRNVADEKPLQALVILNLLADHALSDEVLRLRARAHLANKDFEGAIADMKSLTEREKPSAEDRLLQSMILQEADRLQKAARMAPAAMEASQEEATR